MGSFLSSGKRQGTFAFAFILLSLLLVSAACGGSDSTAVAPTPVETAQVNLATSTLQAGVSEDSTYLLFNQKLVEGLTTQSVDLSDVDAVFWHIFSRLPDEVTVYPSEN